MRATTCFALLPAASLLALHVHLAGAYTYNVLADEDLSTTSSSAGLNSIDKVYSLSDALASAVGGDVIILANGTYNDKVESVVSGEEGNPITIMGEKGAVVQATSPSIHIEHSWITIEGFTVDGYHGDDYEEDSFVNKCVEVIGLGENETYALEGFVMRNMLVQNCGGECVRLKNFVVNASITDNTIEHCGIYDFEFADNSTTDGKNGEGIYIGTSSKQWTYGEDRCNGNVVSGNTIATYGNECVEMKEGSSGNIIENNVCSNQRDQDSGCFCSRGDSNTFRFNNVSDCEGAGVRLGGWEMEGHQYGQNNSVYGNNIYHVDNGAISVNTSPQQVICDNTCEDGECSLTGDDDSLGSMEETWEAECPSEAFYHDDDGDDDDAGDGDDDEVITPAPVAATPSPVVRTPSPTVEPEDDDDDASDDVGEYDDESGGSGGGDDNSAVDDDGDDDDDAGDDGAVDDDDSTTSTEEEGEDDDDATDDTTDDDGRDDDGDDDDAGGDDDTAGDDDNRDDDNSGGRSNGEPRRAQLRGTSSVANP